MVRGQTWQENAVIGGLQADGLERAIKAPAKHLRDTAAACEFDKRKLAAGNLRRDARKNPVKLRQVFRQGLTAPKSDGICAQAKLCPVNAVSPNVRWLVVDRER